MGDERISFKVVKLWSAKLTVDAANNLSISNVSDVARKRRENIPDGVEPSCMHLLQDVAPGRGFVNARLDFGKLHVLTRDLSMGDGTDETLQLEGRYVGRE